MNTIRFNKGNVKLVAHRGLSGIETENTCAAFIAAGNRDYFGIETDTRLTADGKFILMHDDTTTRVSGVELTVAECNYAALRSISLKEKNGQPRGDLRIASLEEYFRLCARYEKVCVLELKGLFSCEKLAEMAEAKMASKKVRGIRLATRNALDSSPVPKWWPSIMSRTSPSTLPTTVMTRMEPMALMCLFWLLDMSVPHRRPCSRRSSVKSSVVA